MKPLANIEELRTELKRGHPNVSHWVNETKHAVEVDKIVVPKEMRGKGLGSRFMSDVINYAESKKKPVALSPSSDFGGNKKKLETWYKGMGFKKNKSDFRISQTYIREPKPLPDSAE